MLRLPASTVGAWSEPRKSAKDVEEETKKEILPIVIAQVFQHLSTGEVRLGRTAQEIG